MKLNRRTLAIAVWLISMGICCAVIFSTRFIADLSAFMPKAPSARQQLLVEQLRDGIVARLIMVGIEGGTPQQRAQTSDKLAQQLRAQSAFLFVQNGDAKTRELDRSYFFDNRYLLSPTVNAERFTASGMHAAIGGSIDALSSDAGMLLKHTLARDPTGELVQFLNQFASGQEPRNLEGVWASHDGERAILLAQIRASGTDTQAQHLAIETIKSAFTLVAGEQAQTRLVMSGTSVFAVSARNTIEREVKQLAIASTVFVIGLLMLIYRSIGLLLLGLLPVLTGALAGIVAVSLGFGEVHALTLGFGTTLIGEAVDYSIYLFIQHAGNIQRDAFWRTIRLGVLTSIAGFSVLLFSGFPGLSQLGLFSIGGLFAAVLVTRYLLPLLMTNTLTLPDMTPMSRRLHRLTQQATKLPWLVAVLMLISSGVIVYKFDALWNQQLSALSPISVAEQQLEHELRTDLGSSDMQYFATFTASTEEESLHLAEQTSKVFTELVKNKVLGGFNSPSNVLPSLALQKIRQAALPDSVTVRARLKSALVDLPIRAERLEGFVQDMDAARTRALLNRADLTGTSAALLYDSLMIKRATDYLVLIPLRPFAEGTTTSNMDFQKIDAALATAGLSKVVLIDLAAETSSLFQNYLQEAKLLSSMGFVAIVLLLLFSLRSVARTIRVVIPLVCAVLCVTALLVALGTELTIFHLIGLLLVVAVGSNYALFFDGNTHTEMDSGKGQMQVSLLIANLATVGSFGILGISQIPVLNAIGSTVGIGAFLALLFSAILAKPAPNHAQR